MRLMIFHANECSHQSCTGYKLVDAGFAEQIHELPQHGIVLNFFAEKILTKKDKKSNCLVALDFLYDDSLAKIPIMPNHRRLPGFEKGRYSLFKSGRYNGRNLATCEALAAALIVLGELEQAKKILSVFPFGQKFLERNHVGVGWSSTPKPSHQSLGTGSISER